MAKKHVPRISVIVPVYQVEAWLKACLDSILGQSFTDWELLLIDDGSRDQSGEICDAYARRDKRIRVFHQANQGLSAARNTGLAHARGEFITLVDSDDVLLSPDYLQELLDALEETGAQVSMCGVWSFWDGTAVPAPHVNFDGVRTFSGREVFIPRSLPPDYTVDTAFTKLYRREVFDGVVFPAGRIIEDYATAHYLLYPCKIIALSGKSMYGYRLRKSGIMGGADGATLYRDFLAAGRDRVRYFHQQGDAELEAAALVGLHSYAARFYLRALFLGDAEKIPAKDRPNAHELLSHMERDRSRQYAKLVLLQYDPHHRTVASRQFFSAEIRRITALFNLIRQALGQADSAVPYPDPMEERALLSLAREERVGSLVSHALLAYDSPQMSEMVKECAAIREEKNKARKQAAEYLMAQLARQRLPFIRLEGFLLQDCYPAFWLWDKGELAFLLPPESADALPPMKRFDPSQSGFPGQVLWLRNPGGRIAFVFDLSYGLAGRPKAFFQQLTKTLLAERREMTPAEVYVLLLSRLHAALSAHRPAALADVVDIGALWLKHGGSMEGASLERRLRSLSLYRFHQKIQPLAVRALSAPFTEADMTPDEKKLLFSIADGTRKPVRNAWE